MLGLGTILLLFAMEDNIIWYSTGVKKKMGDTRTIPETELYTVNFNLQKPTDVSGVERHCFLGGLI